MCQGNKKEKWKKNLYLPQSKQLQHKVTTIIICCVPTVTHEDVCIRYTYPDTCINGRMRKHTSIPHVNICGNKTSEKKSCAAPGLKAYASARVIINKSELQAKERRQLKPFRLVSVSLNRWRPIDSCGLFQNLLESFEKYYHKTLRPRISVQLKMVRRYKGQTF